MARALPDVSVKDHFGAEGFSANKRMFLTVWHEHNKANLRLSPEEQRRFLSVDGEAFSPIDNAWGRQGWTSINLAYVEKADFQKALAAAWDYSKIKSTKLVTPKKKSATKKKLVRKSK